MSKPTPMQSTKTTQIMNFKNARKCNFKTNAKPIDDTEMKKLNVIK